MRYRHLGTAGPLVSEVAFGGGDNAGAMVRGSSRAQTELVARALELGINLFDTSPAYGRGASEVNLGRVLEDLGAADALVMTKAYVDRHQLHRIGPSVTEGIDASLYRLRRERLDVVLLHNPIRDGAHPVLQRVFGLTPAQALDEALPALAAAQAQGKVGLIGIACDDCEPALALPVIASGQVQVIDVAYNLANPSAARPVSRGAAFENYQGVIAAAEARGIGIAAVRPLAGGALAGAVLAQGLDGLHDLSRGYFRNQSGIHQHTIAAARHFAGLARPGDQTLVEAAWRFVLAHPAVSTVIGGFSDIAQLDEAAWAAETPLSAQDLAAVEAIHQARFA